MTAERRSPTNTSPSSPGVQQLLSQTAATVDGALASLLGDLTGPSPRLIEAMRYSLQGGKRLRPTLVLWCSALCGGGPEQAMPAALAIECVHAFSLVHDDLPALDDDDLRRGRPTCHKRFDEATAILAGDALLALAFDLVTRQIADPAVGTVLVRELSVAAGVSGIIGGEAADLEGETAEPDATLVARIHACKTARLFEAACKLGGLAAGADDARGSALAAYGRAFGLAFQAADDLLDVTSRSEVLGKAAGKDSKAGKQTYPRVVGMEASRRIAREAAEQAVAALAGFGAEAGRLFDLARFVVERDS